MKKRILSIVLAICMVLALMPTSVYAEDISGNHDEDVTVNIGDTISGGTFNGTVENNGGGTIKGGTFNGTVENNGGGIIKGGTFNGKVDSNGAINNGTFNGEVWNDNGGLICGGTFRGHVLNHSGGTINDGTFDATVNNSAQGIIYGGTFNSTVFNIDSTINGGTFYSTVDNETGRIYDGTFYGTVDNEIGRIYGGTFYGTVDNENGAIAGGTFYDTITGSGYLSGVEYRRIVTFDSNGGSAVSSQDIVKDSTATEPTAPTREGYNFIGWYKDGNPYDFTQPVTDNITLTAQWKDTEKPVITGLEHNKTYCDTVELEVSDNDGVASVTANDVELTATNGKYILEKGMGTVKVVATDNSGNTADVTVTVNDGHTWNNGVCSVCNYTCVHKDTDKNHACDYCDANVGTHADINKDHKCDYGCSEAIGTHEDTNSDHKCDYGCNEAIGIHEDTNSDHKCDYGCSEAIGTHEDTNSDHKCDYGCNVEIGVHADTNSDHNCDYCGAEITTCIDDDKNHLCDICATTLSDHSGGTATCVAKAICEYCGEEYGEVDSRNHNVEKVFAKDSSVVEIGNIEYWHCLDCGKFFEDENGENEINLDDTVISKLPPEIIEGEVQSITAGEKKELIFRSNAAFGDFIRVELDGITVDAENYTATEGSTIITLKADYVRALSTGEHTIGIVSESGIATTTFTVNAKAEDDTPQTEDDTPQTEDDTPQTEDDTPQTEDDTPQTEDDTPQIENDTPQTEDDTPQTEDDTPQTENDTTVPSHTENNSMKSPQTGNDSNTALWLVLLLSCGGAIIVGGAYGKRKKHSVM